MNTSSAKNLSSAALVCLLMGVAALLSLAQEVQAQQELTADSQGKPVARDGARASEGEDTDELRKEAQNPVASLISVPFQGNWNFGVGQAARIQNVTNIQPVIPIGLGKDWNLIIRWITPVIYQPVNVPQPSGSTVQSGYYGLGDMQPAFFISPKKGKLIWGVGPQLLLPTATKTGILGQGKFGMGPSAVVLVQPDKWTLGFLVNNVWSVAGNDNFPEVNQFLLQYFINYNLKKGWYLTWQPILTANWKATNGGRWVVPLGGGVGRIMRLGAQPVNLTAQFYGNAVHPPRASPWGMRLQISFLFPKMPKKQPN